MPEEERVKPQASVVAILAEMNKGKTLLQVDSVFQEMLEALKVAGGKGNVTLKFTGEFLQQLDNDAAQIAVSLDIKSTLPKTKVVPAVFFVDDKCAVTREDPNQLKLDLQRAADAANVRQMVQKEA